MKPQPQINTLSELLATAIADARRLDRDQYQPRYRNWHFPNSQGFCEICLGGSFVAGTLGCSPAKEASPWNFPRKTHARIEALNAMRSGAWIDAYRLFHQRNPTDAVAFRMVRLPVPARPHFLGWEEFDVHLKSLESIIPKLREIESLPDPDLAPQSTR